MFDSLLVPLDGSALAERAVDAAVALAKPSGAKLHLVRVHAPYPAPFAIDAGSLVAASDSKWDAHLRRREQAYLATAARQAKKLAGRAVGVHLLDAYAPAAISACAATLPSPMIVMSTHGHSGLSRSWIGSVADGVVRTARCPVFLVRSDKPASSRVSLPPQRILIPLDGSRASEAAIQPAVALAALGSAEIILMSVAWDGSTSPLYWLAAGPGATGNMEQFVDDEQRRVRGYLADVEARIRKLVPKVLIRSQLLRGDRPAPAIVEATATLRVDVIAMTTHGRGASRLLLGSVVDKVIRGVSANVLVVRPRSRRSALAGAR